MKESDLEKQKHADVEPSPGTQTPVGPEDPAITQGEGEVQTEARAIAELGNCLGKNNKDL